jgi:hypothetical protein
MVAGPTHDEDLCEEEGIAGARCAMRVRRFVYGVWSISVVSCGCLVWGLDFLAKGGELGGFPMIPGPGR